MIMPSRGERSEPGQVGNEAALTNNLLCGGFLFLKQQIARFTLINYGKDKKKAQTPALNIFWPCE